MAGMARYPDKHFELAIVDPPYGIGNFIPRVGSKTRPWAKSVEWNDSIPIKAYFSELERISKQQIIWGANYYNCFTTGGALIWYKGDTNNQMSHCEIASLSFQKKVDFVHINWQSGFHRVDAEGMQIHPCQKPIALYRWLLKNYAKPGDKILDTHLGSGSSRIAADEMGFDFTGFELDADYFAAQERRFKIYKSQLQLFPAGNDSNL